MFKEIVVAALKKSSFSHEDKKMVKAIEKIENQKRLSSGEFLSVYDSLWKEGPAVSYKNLKGELNVYVE